MKLLPGQNIIELDIQSNSITAKFQNWHICHVSGTAIDRVRALSMVADALAAHLKDPANHPEMFAQTIGSRG